MVKVHTFKAYPIQSSRKVGRSYRLDLPGSHTRSLTHQAALPHWPHSATASAWGRVERAAIPNAKLNFILRIMRLKVIGVCDNRRFAGFPLFFGPTLDLY